MSHQFFNIELLDYRFAEVRKAGNRIYVNYYIKNPATGALERKRIYVNRHSSAVMNIKHATAIAEKLNLKLQGGFNPYLNVANKKLFTPVIEALNFTLKLKAAYLRKKPLSDYRSRLNKMIEWIEHNKLQQLQVNEFTEILATAMMNDFLINRNIKGRTYNNYLTFFRTTFNTLLKQKFVTGNPFKEIMQLPEQHKIRQPFSQEQSLQYKTYLEKNDPDFLIVSMLCYYCALRPNEIVQLKTKHIDFSNHCITVPSEVAKNKRERRPPVYSELHTLLINHLKNIPGDYYIVSTGMKPGLTKISPSRIADRFRTIADKLKFSKELQFYSLKDTCADRLISAGYDVRVIRDLFDHTNIGVTDNYLRGRANKNLERLKTDFPQF